MKNYIITLNIYEKKNKLRNMFEVVRIMDN